MGQPKRREVISEKSSAAVKAVRRLKVSKEKNSLSSLPVELQLGIVHFLPRTSLLTICQLNKHWHGVGRDELLRRLLPITPCKTKEGISLGKDLLERVIFHLINTNNVDALQHLLDFSPKHPYYRPPTRSRLRAEPASLCARVTKDEEERFFLGSDYSFSYDAVNAAFKFSDISCMQLLIDHGLADYSWLLDVAVNDSPRHSFGSDEKLARPIPGMDSRSGHNLVLNWLLAGPPRHVVQAMLVMWGRPIVHPRLEGLYKCCDWRSRDPCQSCDNMLILAASRGHPASLQTIDELWMMVEIFTDHASGRVIPEARRPMSHALRIARAMASMWPGTPSLVAEYLRSVCTWEDHQSSSRNTNNPPPPPAPPLILPPQDYVLHQSIDLKTYDEMLKLENWRVLQRAQWDHPLLMWLVSTEFLDDAEAARRMRCFKWLLRQLHSWTYRTYSLLHVAGAFRRWRCVEVVLDELHGRWPDDPRGFESRDVVLCRAIIDAVHGEPGCADGRIIRKLLQTDARDVGRIIRKLSRTEARGSMDLKGFSVYENMPKSSPFRGGWFSCEPFRLAFVERQQDREKRETPACMEMRDAILECLSITDQMALDLLVGKPSKALYRASMRRRRKRLADKRVRGKGAGGGC